MGLFASAEQKAEKDFQTGYEAFYHSHASNRYEKAEKYLGRAARAGNAKAMFHYGQLLDCGDPGPNALEWALKAAEAGYDEAIKYCIGYYSAAVRESRPEQADWEKAAYWARRGAELGIRGMDALLAEMEQARTPEGLYRQGLELARKGRFRSAMKKMEHSGREGYAPAMLWCAKTYETGAETELSKDTVYPNEFDAAKWYQRAAEAKDPEALYRCARLYETGGLEPPKGRDAKDLINEYYLTAALAGHLQAAERQLELIGQGICQGDSFRNACQTRAREGDVRAGCLCAELKRLGEEVTLPDEQLLRCCEQAAQQGMPLGQYNYGRLLEEGTLTARDRQKALAWYEKAAAAGYERASLRAAGMYLAGEGCEQDQEKGRALLRGVTRPGRAAAALARALLEGEGTARDPQRACELYTEAAAAMGVRVRFAEKDDTNLRLLRLGQEFFTRRQYAVALPLLRSAAGPLGGGYIAASLRMAMLYRRGMPDLAADHKAAAREYRAWYEMLSPGDAVRMGSYPVHRVPEDYRSPADNDPLLWHVLEAKDGRVLLLCSVGLEYGVVPRPQYPLFDRFEQPFVEEGPFNLTEEQFDRYLAGQKAVPVRVQASSWATAVMARALGFECESIGGVIRIRIEDSFYASDEISAQAWEEKKRRVEELTDSEPAWGLEGGKVVSAGRVERLRSAGRSVLRPAVWVKLPPPPQKS